MVLSVQILNKLDNVCSAWMPKNYLPNKSIFMPAFDFQNTDKLGDLVFELKNFFSQETNSTFQNIALHTKSRIFGLTNSAVKIPIPIISDVNEFKLIPFADNSRLEGVKTRNSFITEHNNTLYFKSGTHFVKGDIFIPHDFDAIISPGCSLFFEENSTFISRGRILAIGLPNNPILISGSKKSWGGLLLSESSKTSIFENVFFRKMAIGRVFIKNFTMVFSFYTLQKNIRISYSFTALIK